MSIRGSWLCLAILLGVTAVAPAQQPPASVQAVFQCSRTSPFRDEMFEVVLEITTAGVDIGQDIGVRSLPPPDRLIFTQFQELPAQRRMQGDVIVSTRRFRSTARATVAGSLTLSPVLELRFLSRRRTFFGSMMEERPGDVPVTPLVMSVRDLPAEGASQAFSGAVGRFQYTAVLSPSDVATGELVTLRHTIQGTGYLAKVAAPALPATPLFRVYAPKLVKDEQGIRSFEQILVPRSTTATAIPVTSFVFFDPIAERYQTMTKGPHVLRFHTARAANFEAYKPSPAMVPAAMPPATEPCKALPWRAILAATAGLIFLAGVATIVMQRGSRRGTILVVIALILAIAAWWFGAGLKPPSTVTEGAVARLCPAATAEKTFSIEAGEHVWIREYHADWVRVSTGSRGGWIPGTAILGSSGGQNSPGTTGGQTE